MRVIVTGHTGTIGKHLSDEFIKSGISLMNVSETLGAKSNYADAAIIHLAGIVGPAQVAHDLTKSYEVNVINTLEFAQKSLELGVTRFVFASTSHVYAKFSGAISEDHMIEPQNLYAEQKVQAEIGLKNLFLSSPAELVILRIFSVLDWDCKDYTLGGLFRRIAGGDENLSIRNADDERDFLTPKSIAKIIEKITFQAGMSGVWNLSSGTPVSVREAAIRMLTDTLGEKLSDRMISGQSDSPRIIGNNQKLHKALPEADLSWTPSLFRKGF
jgi:nucleoside-diphosphate-sugar epimerase